jgi:hypothetical protein
MVGLMATDANEESPVVSEPSLAQRLSQYAPIAALFGIAAGVSVDQTDETDKAIRLGVLTAQEFLAGSAALGAAFGAIVIAVLALISIWFDQTYLDVLDKRGGWDYAMRPFRVTGTVSVLTTLVAVVGLFAFAPATLLLRALILGITGGLLTWSIFGTLVTISLLFEHGHERAELMADLQRAKDRAEVRRGILRLQSQVEKKELSTAEFVRQRDQYLQLLDEGQRRLLLDELNAAQVASPPLAQPDAEEGE